MQMMQIVGAAGAIGLLAALYFGYMAGRRKSKIDRLEQVISLRDDRIDTLTKHLDLAKNILREHGFRADADGVWITPEGEYRRP